MRNILYNIYILFILLFITTACVRTPTQETTSPVITQHITIINNSSITGADVAGLNLEKSDTAPSQSITKNEEHGRNNWIFYTIAFIISVFIGFRIMKGFRL